MTLQRLTTGPTGKAIPSGFDVAAARRGDERGNVVINVNAPSAIDEDMYNRIKIALVPMMKRVEAQAKSYVVGDSEVYSAKGAKLRSLGQVFNNKYSEAIVNTWSFLTLIPRLGIRSAIEEIGVFGLVATPKTLVNLIRYGYSTSRAKRIVTDGDAKFFESKGIGAPSRILYAMFKPGLTKQIKDSVELDSGIDNIALQTNVALQKGRFSFKRSLDEQVTKDTEDFVRHGIDSTGYKEATMAATAGTNISGAAAKGYGSGIVEGLSLVAPEIHLRGSRSSLRLARATCNFLVDPIQHRLPLFDTGEGRALTVNGNAHDARGNRFFQGVASCFQCCEIGHVGTIRQHADHREYSGFARRNQPVTFSRRMTRYRCPQPRHVQYCQRIRLNGLPSLLMPEICRTNDPS